MIAKLDPVAVFMVGTVVALHTNYPDLNMQRGRIEAQSRAALMIAGIILTAARSPASRVCILLALL